MFTVPYFRPKSLRHVANARLDNVAEYDDIVSKQDVDLGWDDYNTVFQSVVPKIGYPDVAYYLPLAIAYIGHSPNEANIVIDGVVGFVSDFNNQLEKDNLRLDVWFAFESNVDLWTSRFHVMQVTRYAHNETGRSQSIAHIVDMCDALVRLLNAMFRGQATVTLGEFLVLLLASEARPPESSAWLLELFRQVALGNCEVSMPIKAMLNRAWFWKSHLRRVQEHFVDTSLIPISYWNMIVELLGHNTS